MNTGFAVALGNFVNVQVMFAVQEEVQGMDMEKDLAILERFYDDFKKKNK